jgi:hypothetical protein
MFAYTPLYDTHKITQYEQTGDAAALALIAASPVSRSSSRQSLQDEQSSAKRQRVAPRTEPRTEPQAPPPSPAQFQHNLLAPRQQQQASSHGPLHSSSATAAGAGGAGGDSTDDDDMCIEEVDDVQEFEVDGSNGQLQVPEVAKLAPARAEKRKHVSCAALYYTYYTYLQVSCIV